MPKDMMSKDMAAQVDGRSPLIQVQMFGSRNRGEYRGHGRGYYRGGHHRGYRDRDDGAGIAAGAMMGLVLGSVIASQAQGQGSVDYCIQRFRSYDPQSGTYLGYDGLRHPCP
jgi:hypothetical protein